MREKFRNRFRKISSVVGSVLLVGSTIGFAMAAGGGFPAPFVESNTPDYAIVVGAGAAASDMVGANSINAYLNTFYTVDSSDTSDTSTSTSTYTGDFSDAVGITEDEVALGGSITGQLKVNYTDNKISTLLDTEVSWNDGVDSKNYDVHEEINILKNGLVLKTTLDDSELVDNVVLENSKALEYRFVFDDELKISQVGKEEADSLYLTILGKEYEVLKMEGNSITVSSSDEKVVKTGDKVVSDGVTLSIGDIFLGSVEVNGVLIKEGRTKTINGIEVKIDTIAYHSTTDLPSKAIIKVGKDISQKISSEEEYTEDDETWVWNIDLTMADGSQYIGVTYDINSVSYDEDETEENAITVGQSYNLPENYGAVVFEGLTDVTYEDFELSFDDANLYNGETESERVVYDGDVAILEGENDDSITLTVNGMSVETDSIYFKYVESMENPAYVAAVGEVGDVAYVPAVAGHFVNGAGECIIDAPIVPEDVECDFLDAVGEVGDVAYVPAVGEEVIAEHTEVYFKDIDGDIDEEHEGRIQLAINPSAIKLVVGDNYRNIDYKSEVGNLTLSKDTESIKIALGLNTEGNFDRLGTKDSDAESSDVIVNETSIGTQEDDVLTHYGTIVRDPESNADSDRVVLSVSDSQVYAKISVKGQGMAVELSDVEDTVEGNETVVDDVVPELGGVVILDSEVASHTDKNLILIGGSCINSATAQVLGVAYPTCREEFTLKTGVTANQYLIQSFDDAGRIAVVVAGYEAADTTRGVADFIASETDFSVVGTKVIA